MRRFAVPVLATLCVALLAASVGALVAGVGEDDGALRPKEDRRAAAVTSTSVAAPPAPAGDSAIEAVVPELSKFVERERKRSFLRPVKVALLDEAAFKAALLGEMEEDAEEVQATQDVLRALSLLEDDVDLGESIEQLVGEGVIGFYDHEKDELAVRGQEVTPYVKLVLVHELTHALDDQHFDLDRDLGDEAAAGFDALVEGSALFVDDRYRRSLSRADREQIEDAEEADAESADLEGVPDVLLTFFGFPYAYGQDLVEAIVDDGGMKALDAAFADPPTTTEQVLDPRRYLDRDPPTAVEKPRADGSEIQDGEIGQLALFLLLDARLGRNRAGLAAQGWDGDRYVAWRDGNLTCVRFTTVLDTARDGDELRSALEKWAEGKDRTEVEGDDRITMTTCS